MTVKIEVEIWEMKEGKNTILKDDDGELYYNKHKHIKESKPQYYFMMLEWIKTHNQFMVKDFLKDHPKAQLKKIGTLVALFTKDKIIRQRDDIKKGLLEVVK